MGFQLLAWNVGSVEFFLVAHPYVVSFHYFGVCAGKLGLPE